jgi:hypothetical protein
MVVLTVAEVLTVQVVVIDGMILRVLLCSIVGSSIRLGMN